MVRKLTFVLIASLLPLSSFATSAVAPAATPAPAPVTAANTTYQQSMLQWVKATDFAKNAADVVVAKLKQDMQNNPQLKASVTPQLEADLKQYFYELFVSEKMTKGLATVYAQYFTPIELNELIKFYQSPVGQKLVKATPVLSAKSEQVGLTLLKEHQRGYMEIIAKHVKPLQPTT